MQRRKKWALGLVALALVASAAAAWHLRLPGIAWYWLAMKSQAEERKSAGVWLPHYRVAIDALPVEGVDENASGLTYSDHTGTLFSITNKNPMAVLELDTDGRLLRSIELVGASDPEGITHVRDNIFAIADERRQAIYRVEIGPETTRIDVGDGARLGLSLGSKGNLGFEGISWDSVGQRLFISQEKAPMRVLVVTGLPGILNGNDFNLQIDEWRPTNASGLFVTDLSSLTRHEATGNLLLLSDESALIVEYDSTGKPVSMLPMWRGFHGLSRTVPQAEGLAVGPDGTIYVMSEPNLFYRFERTEPAAWAK
ncbi:MAG: SdiA-regulated domain-containing protein [Zoogloeaceae bacterium]|nr:SdiA-regulated domain-containing protein [Zoogloeaceae bacterium]